MTNEKNTYIGVLAKETQVPVKTIRYYEELGLLDKPKRTSSGYRVYSHDTVSKLGFIKKAQALGFTLSEIRGIIKHSRKNVNSCCSYLEKELQKKLGILESKMAELRQMKKGLKQLLESWVPPKDRKKIKYSVCPQIEKGGSRDGKAKR